VFPDPVGIGESRDQEVRSQRRNFSSRESITGQHVLPRHIQTDVASVCWRSAGSSTWTDWDSGHDDSRIGEVREGVV